MENKEEKQKIHRSVLKYFTKLSLQVVILFAIAIVYSFLTQYLQSSGFFGDTLLPLDKQGAHEVDSAWDWGTRHYLFFWMSILLFIIQLVRIIVFGITEGVYTFDKDEK
jgi:hypothetical protein